MPTYEYACRECGEHLEVVQSFRDDPLTECPACSGPLRKVFSPIGIAFKGPGFYKTDSRGGGGSSRAASGTSSSDAASSSDGAGSSADSSDSPGSSDSSSTAAGSPGTDSSSSGSEAKTA